jgi:hypothetical protein
VICRFFPENADKEWIIYAYALIVTWEIVKLTFELIKHFLQICNYAGFIRKQKFITSVWTLS